MPTHLKEIDVVKLLDYLQLMIAVVDAYASDFPLPTGIKKMRDRAAAYAADVELTMTDPPTPAP